MISIEDIVKAKEKIEGFVHTTPILSSDSINKMFDCEIFFKCENFQKAGAFKIRGAMNAVLSKTDSELKQGVVTHSSGNHAQAISLAAQNKNIKAFIVMPENSNKIKVNAVKSYGGVISFCKPTQLSREQTAAQIMNKTKATFIHPYDNLEIITGQATCAYEALQTINYPDIIMAPVGGGGLLSGTALSAKNINSNILVYGAEPLNANDAYQSFYSKEYTPSINPDTMADGLRTSLGKINFKIIKQYVDVILTCKEESILKAIKIIYERLKIVIEPSAAVPLACVIENPDMFVNKRLCIIVSGGNIDLVKLGYIFET